MAIKEIEILDNEIGFSIKNDIVLGDTVVVVRDSEMFYGFYLNNTYQNAYVFTQGFHYSYLRYNVIRIIKGDTFRDITRGKEDQLNTLFGKIKYKNNLCKHKDLEIYHTRLVLFEKKNNTNKWRRL